MLASGVARFIGGAEMTRILFITANRLGDAVLSTGVLRHCLERYPNPRFTVAAGPIAAPLFRALPGLERIVPIHKRRSRGLHWLKLWGAVGLQRWDVAIDMRRSAFVNLVRARERMKVPKPTRDMHRVELIGGTVGRECDPPAPMIWCDGEAEAAARQLLPLDRPVLAIGPTANWPGKVWPAARYAELVGRLTAPKGPLADATVAVLGGPGEADQAAPVLDAVPEDRRVNLVGTVDLVTLAACLKQARLYIGNDSGLMHMAAAAGAPTLGLFGPSRHQWYRPWGQHADYVRTDMEYEDIIAQPGYDHRTAGSQMEGLPTERVLEAATRLLQRTVTGEAA